MWVGLKKELLERLCEVVEAMCKLECRDEMIKMFLDLEVIQTSWPRLGWAGQGWAVGGRGDERGERVRPRGSGCQAVDADEMRMTTTKKL